MIEDAISGRFDMIITKEVSRFARNTIDSIKYTDYLLKNGVIVNFLNDNLNTLDETCEFRLTIMSSLAQDEVRKLSSRVKFGLERSVKDGKVLGGGNITGYYKEKGRLYINEEEASMIRMLFSLYATGKYGFRTIGKKLYEEGYKNTKGKPYADRVLRRMLTNPKYKGYYCGNISYIEDYKTHKKIYRPKEEWIIYKDENIPAIISEIASPASTSPPIVLRIIKRPFISRLSSIVARSGIICSYFVALLWGGRSICPSICPIIVRQNIFPLSVSISAAELSFIRSISNSFCSQLSFFISSDITNTSH